MWRLTKVGTFAGCLFVAGVVGRYTVATPVAKAPAAIDYQRQIDALTARLDAIPPAPLPSPDYGPKLAALAARVDALPAPVSVTPDLSEIKTKLSILSAWASTTPTFDDLSRALQAKSKR